MGVVVNRVTTDQVVSILEAGDPDNEVWAAFSRAVTLFAYKARLSYDECVACAWIWAHEHPQQLVTAWNRGGVGGLILRVRGRLTEVFKDYKHHKHEECNLLVTGFQPEPLDA